MKKTICALLCLALLSLSIPLFPANAESAEKPIAKAEILIEAGTGQVPPRSGEGVLLNAAHAFQLDTDYHKRTPKGGGPA